MQKVIILVLIATVVAGNMCQNQDQAMAAPIYGNFRCSGNSSWQPLGILEDYQREILYFIEYDMNFGGSAFTVIYRTDYNLTIQKVKRYNIYIGGNNVGFGLNKNGSFIYTLPQMDKQFYEISTADPTTMRKIALPLYSFTYFDAKLEIYNSLYFNIRRSIMETCKWDTSSTLITWIGMSTRFIPVFAPISDELLFIGSTNSVLDQYYLILFNFSDPSNYIWKKSIACETTSCSSESSRSLYSLKFNTIFTLIPFGGHILLYEVNATDGSPLNPGYLLPFRGSFNVFAIEEFDNLIAIQLFSYAFSPPYALLTIDPGKSNGIKVFKSSSGKTFYGIGRVSYQGVEIMYQCGRTSSTNVYFERNAISRNGEYNGFANSDVHFTPITDKYQIKTTTSTPGLYLANKNLAIFSETTITETDIKSSINPTFTSSVALWNQDHLQSVQSDSFVKVNFTWAWTPSTITTNISFSLAQKDSHEIPEWVQLDAENQELYLNKTPIVTEITQYYFSLKIEFNSETHYKNFEITVQISNASNNSSSTDEEVADDANVDESFATIAGAFAAWSVAFASASSLISKSSVNSIFSTINSLQLAILLPLIPDYFSPKISTMITGVGFSMLSLEFLSLQELPYIKSIQKWLSYPQPHGYFKSLDIKSGSSIMNLLPLISVLILIWFVHFWIFMFRKCWCRKDTTKCGKAWKRLAEYFTFGIYIRVLIQSFMFTCLAVFSEMYSWRLSKLVTKVSFGISIIIWMLIIAWILLCLFIYVKSLSSRDPAKYSKWKEYFNGIKIGRFSKLYSSLFLLLRFCSGCLIILGRDLASINRAASFFSLNIVFAAYLIIVRPFKNSQDNIIEILNQSLFWSLAAPLIWLNSKDGWTKFYESYYSCIFMASPAIACVICFGYLSKAVISRAKKIKCKKNPESIAPKASTPVEKLKAPSRGEQQEESKSGAHNANSVMKLQPNVERSNVGMNGEDGIQEQDAWQNFRR